MNIQMQKSDIMNQLELVNDVELLKSIQNLLDYGLRHQPISTDFEIDGQTQKIVLERIDNYYKNPADVIDFDTLIDEMKKSI